MSRVLVVDDALFMRNSLGMILKEGGHTVVGQGADGEEAVLLYEALKPDLVTLDITMGPVNGIEALKRIVALDPHARVLMVSAMGQQPIMAEAVALGAKGFIIKPFRKETVLRAVERIIEKGR